MLRRVSASRIPAVAARCGLPSTASATSSFAIAAASSSCSVTNHFRYFGQAGNGQLKGVKAYEKLGAREGIQFADKFEEVKDQFTDEALKLLRVICDKFQGRQDQLLQRRLDKSFVPTMNGKLESVSGPRRKFDVASTPRDLHERKVELTGPCADPAMSITALNTRANGVCCYMGDAEDASTCSLENTVGTLKVNYGIARRDLRASKKNADGSTKEYKLNPETATYIFRVPNLHLPLPSVLIDGEPMSAFLFHAVMYAVTNSKALREHGTGPYLYVPKLEGADEAKFVEEVLTTIEAHIGLERGTIKVTVLVESFATVVELPKVVEALLGSRRIVGINAARWDYLASLHKHFGHEMVFPPRKDLTMLQPFMQSYVKWIVKVAHHYGIHGIGGMSAFIPAKDAEQTKKAMTNARTDKERECAAGLDGAWIAHPGMANIREAFDAKISGHHQIDSTPDDLAVDLKSVTPAFKDPKVSPDDVELNVEIAIEYLAAFISGKGAVALHNLMEDAATMEISRYNLWNHVHHHVKMSNGETCTLDFVKAMAEKVATRVKSGKTQVPYAIDYVDDAKRILIDAVESKAPATFLTLPAMEVVNEHDVGRRINLDGRRPSL